jgi:3-phenylpropionate/trans-cinnamate dioxygenase ferredoxin subunit
VQVDGIGVVVVRTPDGRFRALRDRCPHQGAPLSRGRLLEAVVTDGDHGYALSGEDFVVRCPWHGWEIDVASGSCPADPVRGRVRTYEVSVVDGMLCLER